MANSINKKALLAIVFAGGLLSQATPVLSQSTGESPETIISRIAGDSKALPEVRAFYLLKIAQAYTAGSRPMDVKSLFGNPLLLQSGGFGIRTRRGPLLSQWSDEISWESNSQFTTGQNSKALASESLQKALTVLAKIPGSYSKMNLYFVASHLFHRLGDTAGAKQCDEVVNSFLKNCETKPPPDQDDAKTALSLLTSMAYQYVPIRIADSNPGPYNPHIKLKATMTDENIKKSEQLLLRAVAIGDRLPSYTDARRKAHRDLALWYEKVGKPILADRQKQELFELVGIRNDKILYPVSGSCGRLVWWTVEQPVDGVDCGMG